MAIEVNIKKLEHYDSELPLPQYETLWAAGADVRACLGPEETMVIKPGERVLIPTGLALEIPQGYEIQVRPRSGLSLKTGLMVVNSPGTIDSDYRGELKVIMGNLGTNVETVKHGDRVAQLLLAPVIQAKFIEADELTETKRGEGGFGSTGKD